MTDLVAEILRLSRRMRGESGRGPSAAELAGYLHLPLAEVRAALGRAKNLAVAALTDGGRVGEVPGGLAEALTAADEQALCRRFGIGRDTDQTLEDVSRQFEVTCGRIQRIQAKALAELSRKQPEDS